MSGANVSPRGRNQKLMTRREKTWLVAGLLIGSIVVASIFVGRQYVVSREEPTTSAAEPSLDRAPTVPDAGSTTILQLLFN
jgi:hypothetical protein